MDEVTPGIAKVSLIYLRAYDIYVIFTWSLYCHVHGLRGNSYGCP